MSIINQYGIELSYSEIEKYLDEGLAKYICESFSDKRLTDQEFFDYYCIMHKIHHEASDKKEDFYPNTIKERLYDSEDN